MGGGIVEVGVLPTMSNASSRDTGGADDRRPPSELLAIARQQFEAEIERGLGGRAAHARFSDRFDAIIRRMAAAAPAPRSSLAIAALGGYGRRTLCLYSDVDLLIVFDGRIGREEERFVKAILHPLWDLKLTVGHQVRSLDELARVGDDNPELLLALVDARLLTGDAAVFDRACGRAGHPHADHRQQVLDGLIRLTDERHATFNDTIYQLEPDVKSSPGGLRDLAAARVLTTLAGSPVTTIDARELSRAEDFLLRVRSVLHAAAGRNVNVLSHAMQELAADRLAPGRGITGRVEALMGEYFGRARDIARALARARRLAAPAAPEPAPHDIGPNLQATLQAVGFADLARAAGEPESWLGAFEAALARGLRVDDETLSMLERQVDAVGLSDLLPAPADRRRLLQLLTPARGLYARLSDLHDAGLLDKLLPGFGAIDGRVIRDFYHKYTVDEHTLLTVRGIERLLDPAPARERFGALLGELRAPAHLVLALLFHDVGKWTDGEHAAESVRMARVMFDELGVEADARQDVEFLISRHLEMSRVAFRRDSEDPDVVRQFAALVGTEERLKMLCLLTLVDIEAVGAGTLTPWKEELLWRLYVDTYNHLTLAYGDEVIDRTEARATALVAGRPHDLDEAELVRFLEGFPRRYLALFDHEHIYQHARLSRGIHPDEVHLFLEPRGEMWELAVVTLDKPFLFANLCGALSYFGMDIVRGSAMTSPAGLVLDVFQFADRDGFFRLNPGAVPEFERLLEDVVAGRQNAAALVARKESSPLHRPGPRRVAPVVYFDDEHSQTYTVLENRRAGRARAAAAGQRRDLPARVRRRPRADLDGGLQGHRRLPPHQGGRQAAEVCSTRAPGRPGAHSGGGL